MAHREVPIGKTGSAEYFLKGAWVYRRTPAYTQRYDTLEGFAQELMVGALGLSWHETPEGQRIIDRFVNETRRREVS
jgi:hypothetical protein